MAALVNKEVEERALVKVDSNVVNEFLFSSGTRLTEPQKKLFIAICIRNQLDPFKREIHPVPYKKEDGSFALSIVTGYEVYLARAEKSGKLDGWKVWTEGKASDGSLKACIEIRRKDWSQPLYHEVLFTEYNLNRSLWRTKPITMIKKVCIAQAFRLAFSEIQGLPYTADELPESTGAIDITPKEPEIQVGEEEGASSDDKEEVKEDSPLPDALPSNEYSSLYLEQVKAHMVGWKNKFQAMNGWKKYHAEWKANLTPKDWEAILAFKDTLKEEMG